MSDDRIQALMNTAQLCIEAYHQEEMPGQYLYTAIECLEIRLIQANMALSEVSRVIVQAVETREDHLRQEMQKDTDEAERLGEDDR